jgi:transposase
MSSMVLSGFNMEDLVNKLKLFGRDAFLMINTVKFVFGHDFNSFFNEFNDKFSSKVGRPAYPREMLCIIMLCGYFENKPSPKELSKECRLNDIYKVVCCGKTPSKKVLSRFIKESLLDFFKAMFVKTLSVADELGYMDDEYISLDGSVAKTSGSKYRKIYIEQFEILKKVRDLNLILKRRNNNEEYLSDIEKLERKYEDDEEKLELLKLMKNKPYIYIQSNIDKIPSFEKEFNNSELDFLFLNNPEARLIKTKNGDFDACVNVQVSSNSNHIIINPLISQKVSDNQLFEDEVNDIIENILKMKNSTSKEEITRENIIKSYTFIADSGYMSNNTLEFIENNSINAIIDTRLKIIKDDEEYFLAPEEIDKLDNIKSKKHLKYNASIDAYFCIQNEKFELIDKKPINDSFNKQKNIPEEYKKVNYIYKNNSCINCNIKDKCNNGKDSRTINDRITPLNKKARQKRHDPEFEEIYKIRWKTIESIFGYFKGNDGVLRFLQRKLEDIQKELYLMSITYNIKRINKLKDVPY